MDITVAIMSWVVPYDSTIKEIRMFGGPDAAKNALDFINTEALKWWKEVEGERGGQDDDWPYRVIGVLGYENAHFHAWGGEHGFQAVLDEQSYAVLLEEHYARSYDACGLTRPGYLINSYVAGNKPGGMTDEEAKKYAQQQAEGIASVENTYGKPVKH